MPLVPLLPLFHCFNREHFDGALVVGKKTLVPVRWSDGKLRKTAGVYRRGRGVAGDYGCEIVLSQPLLEHLPLSATKSTLCHEMIHAWIDLVLKKKEVHGANFRARMSAINSAQNKFQVTLRHSFPVPISVPKWWAMCPNCGLRFPYKRIVRKVACRKCCETYSSGMWDSKFLLAFEPAASNS